jgi:hypothetical protein
VNGWKVELRKSAQRELRQLEDGPQRAAEELLQDLAEDPTLVPAIEMRGNPDTCRAASIMTATAWSIRFRKPGSTSLWRASVLVL